MIAVVGLLVAALLGCSSGGSGGSTTAPPTSAPSGGGTGGPGGSGPGGSGGGGSDGGDVAIVPRNDEAAIYDVFGGSAIDQQTLGTVTDRLESEGYHVTRYEDRNEGAGDHGTATLANFVKMAKTASVVLVNGHGEDFSGSSQVCSFKKELDRCRVERGGRAVPIPPPPPPVATRSTRKQPVLQVEWYPTWEAEQAAFDRYVADGMQPDWLYDPVEGNTALQATTLLPPRPGDDTLTIDGKPQVGGYGTRPWMGVTAAGIAHFFGGHDVALVDDLSCHSLAMAPSFDARAVVAHATTACQGFQAGDEPTLFDRLVGKEGIEQREVTAAMGAGGFTDPKFQLWPGSKPVVLSPAVERFTPGDGARVKPGRTTPATVRFDAQMDQGSTDGVVTVEGCDAKVTSPSWQAPDQLSFGITVPDDPSTTSMAITVHHARAQGDPGGNPNQELDGNGDPDGKDGVAPNRDDETYHLSCSRQAKGGLTIRSTGKLHSVYTADGFTYTVDFTWTEQRTFTVSFKDGQFTSAPVDDGTLTATGSATSTGSEVGANTDCHWTAAKDVIVPIIIQTGSVDTSVTPEKRTLQLQAQLPGSANVQGTTSGQLTESGTCDQSSTGGPTPFLGANPRGGTFDPGSKLQALRAGMIPDVDFDALKRKPKVVHFPVSYDEDDTVGGHEHVTATGTTTISVS